MKDVLLKNLLNEFSLREKEMIRLIRSAPYRYMVYTIEKKQKGKFRTIAQPAEVIKMLQRWVVEKYLRYLPIHPSATAYMEKKNIRDNAIIHAKNQFLLKMDFVDFFPSIKPDDFSAYLKKRKSKLFSDNDFELATDILFWYPKHKVFRELELSIGAPSSPILSNLVMYDFDRKVHNLCTRLKVDYSRYADDLTFSTSEPHVLKIVHNRIIQICKDWEHPKLVINHDKTVFSSKKHRRRVTGLIITNEDTISLGRVTKRLIRAQIHRFIMGKLDQKEMLHLKGMLAFAMDVELAFFKRMNNKYGTVVIDQIMKLK